MEFRKHIGLCKDWWRLLGSTFVVAHSHVADFAGPRVGGDMVADCFRGSSQGIGRE